MRRGRLMSDAYYIKECPSELDPSVIVRSAHSCIDDSYIGNEFWAKILTEEYGVLPEIREPHHTVSSIGFCPAENKWYGWKYRTICGFGVGSEVKRGNCAYFPVDMENARLDAIKIWSIKPHLDVTAVETVDKNGRPCFKVSWIISSDPKLVRDEKMRGQPWGCTHYPPKNFGKGEWIAESLEDAKQMAKDFAEGVP